MTTNTNTLNADTLTVRRDGHSTISEGRGKLVEVTLYDGLVHIKWDNSLRTVEVDGKVYSGDEGVFSSTILGDREYMRKEDFIWGEPYVYDITWGGKVYYRTPAIGVK